LGAETCEQVHAVLWSTFKTEADRIATKRNGTQVRQGDETPVSEQLLAHGDEPLLEVNELVMDVTDAASFHSVRGKRAAMSFEHKYKVIDNALRMMIRNDLSGSGACIAALLDAIRDA
jgi:hypothetical protein